MKKITLKFSIAVLLFLNGNISLIAQALSYTVSTNQGCVPLAVTLTNTSTDINATGFLIKFNDGSPNITTAFTAPVNHTFSNVGNYHIVVEAYDNVPFYIGNATCNTGEYIAVNGSSINSPDSACVNDKINFCANGDQINSVSWNFGDGGTSSDQCPNHIFTTLGPKTITLNTSGGQCGNQTLTKTIYITSNAYPHPYTWTFSNTSCPTVPISFNTNSYASYSWNFGDPGSGVNNTSSLQNPLHTYATPGNYTATLVVQNNCGLSGTTTSQTIIISSFPPFPDQNWFKLENSSPSCPNSIVNFNAPNGYSNYQWNFGDGSPVVTTTDNYSNHFYGNITTTDTATVKITSNCGNDTTLTTIVNITNNAPWPNYPDFKLQNPSLACPNSNIDFNAPNGYVSYQWNFGDGSTLVTTTNNYFNHTYGNAIATYNVSVKIINSCGNDTTLVSTVQTSTTAPWPNDNWLNLSVNSPACPNSNVSFNAPSGYNHYQWNFGDGSPLVTTSNNYSNHFYGNSLGSYTVSVKITSACGNDTTLYSTLAITNSAPFPNQSWFKLETSSTVSCPNDNVGFNAPGGYSNYQWNFGDGVIANTTNNYNNHIYGNTITSYTVSVKITNGCGNDTILYKVIQINNNAGFPDSNFELHVNSPACPNSNVGFEAPGGFTNYIWNFGDGSALVTSNNKNYNHTYGSSIQTYAISVKIINGCGNDTTLFTTLEIKNNVGFNDEWFNVEASPNPSCPNDQVNFNAPSGYSSYFWKFGDGDSISSSQNYAHHVYTDSSTYTYSVKITNACGNDTTLFGTIVVGSTGSFYSGLSIESDPKTSSCPDDLVFFKINQDGFQSYFWDFGDGDTLTTIGNEIQHAFDTLGIFTVSCKVSNGCGNQVTIYATVQVQNNSPVNEDLQVDGIQNPSCPGDKVHFLIKHGQATTTYTWDYGDGSSIDTTIGAGSHHIYTSTGAKTVTVTATNACGMSKTITMVQTISSTIFPTLTGGDGNPNWGYPGGEGDNTTAGCAGDAIIFYFAGDAAYNLWDFGDGNTGTATEHVLVDGGDGVFPVTIIKHVFATNGPYVIHLTITNNCGNSVTDSLSINIGGNQVVNGELVTSPPPFTTCAPIDFLAFGGATYAWNFGDGATLSSSSPTASHTFSTQGIYVVTVLITNGCGNTATYSKSINVNGAGGPAITLTSSTSPTCGGGNNGSATISVADGQEPYTYLWNDPNAQDSSTVINLSPGIYYATVTDNIGCASTFAVSISNPAPIVLAAVSTQSACGSSTGTATASVTSGGTSPFTYLWTGGSTAATATGLSYGLYTVTVTDFNACTSSANVSVSEVNTAAITLDTITDAGCNGGSDGAITITIAGGTAPFTYAWSNGAITQNLNNIPAGTYSLLVTDAGSCKATFNATVGQADSMSASITPVASPTCGNFDGSTTAIVTGGTSAYTYLWDANANNQTTQIATGLPAGTYSVTITDAHGCSEAGEISLSNSNAPVISAVVSDVTCNNLGNGSINITITGGTSPYLKTWNVPPPQTNNEDLNTLIPGNYLLFVNDAQGCTSVRSYTITQPALLIALATSTGATCGSNNGTSTVTTSGGNTIASYSWTSGDATQTATGLALGSNSVIVTDVKGCVASDTTTVELEVPTPSICMVTVDEESVNNLIYWDKTSFSAVDSFIVYREVSTSLYKRIGAVAYDSLSEFIDTSRNVGPANGDPNTGTYRYKLQLLDSCGNYSALSPYHNTIYILDIGSGQFSWNVPYTIEGEPNPVTNYNLICDTAGLNTWFIVGTVAGTQTLAVDANFADHTNNPIWRVKTDWGTSCDPTRAPVVTSRSNKKAGITIITQSIAMLNTAVTIYPNPAKDIVTIEFSDLTQNAQLKIVNVLGQTVFSEIIIASTGKKVKQINTGNFAKGVYTVVIETSTEKVLNKLVVN